MEHLCNAIILLEMGNFSKKHFGDFTKLKGLKEKYMSDLAETYQTTYNFRSYGDYRKFPEVKDKFNRGELKNKITVVNVVIRNSFGIIGRDVDIKEITQKLFKTKKQKPMNNKNK
ncbi:hypothetical protein HYT56_03130 [Candidatus Woesearchaeota archaeon]|nr:hypothetical protein [Candidatus Woesearchaeota archaeon]